MKPYAIRNIHSQGMGGATADMNQRNPNNCSTCKHKQNPDGGWCYMFRDEPTETCMQHTGRIGRIGREPTNLHKMLQEALDDDEFMKKAEKHFKSLD